MAPRLQGVCCVVQKAQQPVMAVFSNHSGAKLTQRNLPQASFSVQIKRVPQMSEAADVAENIFVIRMKLLADYCRR